MCFDVLLGGIFVLIFLILWNLCKESYNSRESSGKVKNEECGNVGEVRSGDGESAAATIAASIMNWYLLVIRQYTHYISFKLSFDW